jgi:hypothetical protein
MRRMCRQSPSRSGRLKKKIWCKVVLAVSGSSRAKPKLNRTSQLTPFNLNFPLSRRVRKQSPGNQIESIKKA